MGAFGGGAKTVAAAPAPAPVKKASAFGGIENVKATQGSTYFNEGVYVIMFDKVIYGPNRANDERLVIETEVLHVISESKDEGGQSVSNRVGDSPTQMIKNYGKAKDMFLPNTKALVMGVMGCTEEEVTQEDCILLTGETQPFAKVVAIAKATQIKTKDGHDYTKVEFNGQITREYITKLGVKLPTGAKFWGEVQG